MENYTPYQARIRDCFAKAYINDKEPKHMNIGEACAIFKQIKTDKYTDDEKDTAIHKVLNMATHNSITKDSMLAVIEYLFNKPRLKDKRTNKTITLPAAIGETVYTVYCYDEIDGTIIKGIEESTLSGYIKEGEREFYVVYDGEHGVLGDIEVDKLFFTVEEAEAALAGIDMVMNEGGNTGNGRH